MSKKLAGTLFVFNGDLYDYSYMEAIQCLLEFCDYVIVAAGGEDNTHRSASYIANKNYEKMKVIHITKDHWGSQHGQEKLNYFTNICIAEAQRIGCEYQFNLQADEIVHEKSYPEIRKAISTGAEGFLIKRINLWQDCYHRLDVPHERMPCNTSIVRLAKTVHRSYGDAESLAVPYADAYFYNSIVMWHYGFVRKKEVMKDKIINMQCAVFEMADYDKKLNECDIFDSTLWFNESDLKIIDSPHPKIMKEWIKTRP
jgi:hypothetical protein